MTIGPKFTCNMGNKKVMPCPNTVFAQVSKLLQHMEDFYLPHFVVWKKQH